mmetsp:Transcript_20486/g.44709  ORF Transcript_20486/g.44709 Transcript_20486/m.44709 type:complete len:330 (+) Transcript_20486:141-1130(+)
MKPSTGVTVLRRRAASLQHIRHTWHNGHARWCDAHVPVLMLAPAQCQPPQLASSATFFASGSAPAAPSAPRFAPPRPPPFRASRSALSAWRVFSKASFSRCLCSMRFFFAASAASVAAFRLFSRSFIIWWFREMTSSMANFCCAWRSVLLAASTSCSTWFFFSVTERAMAAAAVAAWWASSTAFCAASNWVLACSASSSHNLSAFLHSLASLSALLSSCLFWASTSLMGCSPISSRTFFLRLLAFAFAFGLATTMAVSVCWASASPFSPTCSTSTWACALALALPPALALALPFPLPLPLTLALALPFTAGDLPLGGMALWLKRPKAGG